MDYYPVSYGNNQNTSHYLSEPQRSEKKEPFERFSPYFDKSLTETTEQQKKDREQAQKISELQRKANEYNYQERLRNLYSGNFF